MTEKAKVRRFGGSLGLIIPKSIAEDMAVQEGDELFIVSTNEGISLTAYDPEFEEALDDAREFMHSHRNAFRQLAS